MDGLITMMALTIALMIVVPVAGRIIRFEWFMHDWDDDIKGCEEYGADYIMWKHGWEEYEKHGW